jgi:apolipoprotein D and lipocalin family protein
MIRTIAAATLAVMLAPAGPALAQATAVDLDRFDGRWFEIARNPNGVQRDCSRAQIDFTPTQAERYSIVVTCVRRPRTAEWKPCAPTPASPTPPTTPSFRFTLAGLLSFGGLASQKYWVWDHAPDYSWAIMALPNQSELVGLASQPEPGRGPERTRLLPAPAPWASIQRARWSYGSVIPGVIRLGTSGCG